MKEDKLLDIHRFTPLEDLVYMAQGDRIISDHQNTFYYNGIPLNTIKDFKKAFKPTKWSSRLYFNYCDSISVSDKINFLDFTMVTLVPIHRKGNKELDTFRSKILAYQNMIHGEYNRESINKSYSVIKPIKVVKGNREILNCFVELYHAGYFDCSRHYLIDRLMVLFDFGLQPSTIRDKFYRLDKIKRKMH